MDKIPRDPQTDRELFEDTAVVSSTECTGLEPTPPENQEETESFAELYDTPLSTQRPEN